VISSGVDTVLEEVEIDVFPNLDLLPCIIVSGVYTRPVIRFSPQEVAMNPSNLHLELVHDALHARSVKQVGCFVFNQSSDRVREVGEPILPALEQVLRDEVMAVCPADAKAQREELPGLSNLLVDYFSIARDSHLERAAEFLSSLHGPVLVEAIRAISIVWDHSIPGPFLSAIETTAQAGSSEERAIATWSLDWHQNKHHATPA
jgi:hypothetical protein